VPVRVLAPISLLMALAVTVGVRPTQHDVGPARTTEQKLITISAGLSSSCCCADEPGAPIPALYNHGVTSITALLPDAD
jgi:hypothetical protein